MTDERLKYYEYIYEGKHDNVVPLYYGLYFCIIHIVMLVIIEIERMWI